MADPPLHRPTRTVQVQGLRDGIAVDLQDCLAEEQPIAFEFNGIAHAVMMATPEDLEDFALGFALSEGIVLSRSDVHDIEVCPHARGITLQITIAAAHFAALKERRRNLTGRTGCGLCGTESLAHAVRAPAPLRHAPAFRAQAIGRAMEAMRAQQVLLSATGSTHAAAWCNADGEIALIREDVGRHNALDKLVGALARSTQRAEAGFVAVTSRASYEMVQKTASAGVATLAAVSGVTALAVDMANEVGLTLLGFARGNNVSVYTHPENFQWS